jgi:phosphatidylcholine synthase
MNGGVEIHAARRRVAAWAVHLLTASGAVWGLLALEAVAAGRLRLALGWLGVALAVDGVDGTLARRLRVAKVVPQIDGALLDNIVDYLNYVFVPAVLIYRAGVVPGDLALPSAAVICTVSAFQFVHREAKTTDSFRGFPSYWNVVAAYLILLEMPPAWAAAWIAGLALLVFAPIRFIYPSRMRRLRKTTLVLTLLWVALLGVAVFRYPDGSRDWARVSLLFPVYYAAGSLVLTSRRRSSTVGCSSADP